MFKSPHEDLDVAPPSKTGVIRAARGLDLQVHAMDDAAADAAGGGIIPFPPPASFRTGVDEQGSTRLGALAAQVARQYSSRTLSAAMLCDILRAAEFVLLAAISIAVICICDMPGSRLMWHYAFASAGGAVAGVAGIQMLGGYEIGVLRTRLASCVPVAGGWTFAVAAIALGLFFTKVQSDMSRVWLGAWYAGGFATLVATRLLFGIRLRGWARAGRLERRIVIVGGGANAEELIRRLQMRRSDDIRICGIFDDRGDRRSPPLVSGYPKLGNIAELVEFMRLAQVDMLIVTLPVSAEKRVLELMKRIWVLPVDIRIFSHDLRQDKEVPSVPLSCVGPVQLLDVFDKPIAGWGAVAKRGFDIVVAGIALAVLMPVMIGTALAIKADSKGPALFRQKRHGFNNQIIDVLKFRSMYHEAADPTARKVVTRNDARVTRVGHFIRKTSIDELPQLWNVLRGDLSLVGPRPHAVNALSSNSEAFIEIVDGYFGRHRVKPGITGWAQVNGYRGEIDQAEKLKKRFEYDLRYIDNWSLLFDVAILAKTPFSLFKTENAY